MNAHKLIDMIEKHSAAMAHELLTRFRSSEKMADMKSVPAQELETRAFDVYHNLSDWLLHRTEEDIERRYTHVGRQRAQQGISLSHLLWALIAIKRHLVQFLSREAMADRLFDLQQEIELIRMVDRFFDLALYYATRGYERELALQAAIQAHGTEVEQPT